MLAEVTAASSPHEERSTTYDSMGLDRRIGQRLEVITLLTIEPNGLVLGVFEQWRHEKHHRRSSPQP